MSASEATYPWECAACGASGFGGPAYREHTAQCEPYQRWLARLARQIEERRRQRKPPMPEPEPKREPNTA